MDLNQLLLIIKAKIKIIGLVMFLVVATTTGISLNLPKSYESSTSLVLNYKGVDPLTGVVLPAQLMPGYMATQIDIITSENVALKVVENLNLAENSVLQEQFSEAMEKSSSKGDINIWLAERLKKGLDVTPSKESSVIQISYTGTDPNFSALMANSFAEAYRQAVVELKIEPAKLAASFLNEQISALRINLENAQKKLSDYQQKHGLTNLNSNLDVETGRLNELSTQLVLAQSQLFDSASRSNSTRGNSSPDVASNPIVQNLKLSVSNSEAKLTELSARYGVRHPQYLSAKAELDKQRKLLSKEILSAKSNVNATNNIYKQREKEIKEALAKQKEKVLFLNASRDEMSVLEAEVINAQEALAMASKRFTQISQESNSNQTDISILNKAVPPTTPTGPRVKLNVALAIILGAFLGLTIGLLLEMMNRKVRSKNDVSKLLEIPVFSIIGNKSKHKLNGKILLAPPFKY